MSDGFAEMVDAAQAFFATLKQNNSKEWFEPHKAHYKEAIAGPAGFFSDLISEDLARITGQTHKPKVFRIYRDVRFSKDKTPLNTHLHLMWSPTEGGPMAPTWFWGLSPDYFIVGLGVMGLQGDGLTRFRAFIDKEGDALQAAIDDAANSVDAQISDWGPEPLKRVPKPYDADHPHAALLKRKALAVTAPMSATWRDEGLLKATLSRVDGLMPLWNVWAQA